MRAIFVFAFFMCSVVSAEFNAHYWRRVQRSGATEKHSVVFAVSMVANAAATCDSMLMERATVGSPLFNKHMSFNEVGALFRNHKAEKQAIRWMRANGIAPSEMRMTPHGEYIRVTTTIAKLERLMKGAVFHKFAAVEDGKRKVHRALDYTLPYAVKSFITYVSDTNTLPVPPSIARRAFRVFTPPKNTHTTKQSGNVSPNLLNSFYNINNNGVQSPNSTISLFESLGQAFSPSDLSGFQQQFNLPQTVVANVIGSNDPNACASDPDNCGEANLDVQWALAVAQNATMTFWSVDGDGDIFLQWIEAVTATNNPPLVHSLSYGSLAPEDPKFDVEQFNTQMCKLGLKGLTLVVASGDDGVANYIARQNASACGFTPSFPATSPYCVSVGATQGPEAGSPEIACTSSAGGLITSGGGFSAYVLRPSWQNDIVNAYLAGGPNRPTSPPRTLFSSLGRAYPDVAVVGHNYPVVIAGQTYVESGTSASAPVVAAMLTLVNGIRLNNGKNPIGYITPTIYKLGAANNTMFNDITSGTNNCCAGNIGSNVCCQYGFTASAGWDPVCGFGSINFAQFSSYFANI